MKVRHVLPCSVLIALAAACSGAGDDPRSRVGSTSGGGFTPGGGSTSSSSSGSGGSSSGEARLAPELGTGDHTPSSVTFTLIADEDDGLNLPRDLEFHPERPEELWIVNRRDDSTVTVFNPGDEERSAVKKIDGYALHFMEEVSSIAFGANNTFGTCQESTNRYNNQAPTGNLFMGPALWSADFAVYAVEDPIGLGSHLDMLHESPLCMGMAWVEENKYWVFDGYNSALVFYDFQEDHGPGYDDHSDGIIHRYAEDEVKREPNVPSHMEWDHDEGVLYVADTGNSRIIRMDPSTASEDRNLPVKEPGTVHKLYEGATVEEVVATGVLGLPSGLALHNGLIYVTDHEDSTISAFNKQGERVNWIETGLEAGTLMGLTIGPDGMVYFVDSAENRVFRIEP